MIQAEKNYINGTGARKIEYDVYKQNRILKAKTKARAYGRIKAKVILFIMVAFAIFALMMYRYALITDMNYKMNIAYREYEKIKNENIKLKVELDKGMNLERIRKAAENELGMITPEKHQIVRLNVMKNDYTVVAADISANKEELTADNSMFVFLKRKLESIAQWLY